MTLNGQDIGVAARATRAVLDRLLARSGTDFDDWVALRTLALSDQSDSREALAHRLSGLLATTEPAVRLLLARLAARGWMTESDPIELAPAGSAQYQQLAGEVATLTAELYRGLDPEEMAAAKRILAEVAHRAEASLST